MLQSGMAQPRRRPTVSLTLNPDTLQETRALLERFPGRRLSVSALVDDLLSQFVVTFKPMVDRLEQTDDRAAQLEILHAFFGMQMAGVSEQFTKLVRATQPEEEGS